MLRKSIFSYTIIPHLPRGCSEASIAKALHVAPRTLGRKTEETGARAYKYIKTGTNHYSFAFTYDCIAWSRDICRSPGLVSVCTYDPNYYDPILHDPF